MADVSHFNIKVSVDSKTGQAELVKFGKTGQAEMEKLKKSADGAGKSMLSFSTLLKGAGVAALGMFAAKAVQGAAELENYGVQFEVLTGSAEKGKKLFEEIRAFGAATPFETKDLAAATNTMLGFGLAQESVMGNLKQLGNISGGNAEKLQSLTLAFSQLTSAGKLTGQDLNQMINAGFNPLAEISAMTGKSMGALRKEMEQGAISADMVKEAMTRATSEGGKFFGMMDKQSQSFTGLLSTLKDTAGMLIAEAGQPFLMLLKDLMPVITPIVEQLGKWLVPIFGELAKVIKIILPPFMELFQKVFKAAQPIIATLFTVLNKIAPVFARLVTAVAALIPAFQPLIDVFIELIEDNLEQLIPLMNVLIQALIDLTPAISLAAQFTANLIRVGAAMVNLVVKPLVDGIKYIIEKGAEAAGWIASIFGGEAAKKVNQAGNSKGGKKMAGAGAPAEQGDGGGKPKPTPAPTGGKAAEKLVYGSAPWMEAQIKNLEKLRDKTVQGSDAWASYTLQIAAMQAEMDVFKRIAEDLAGVGPNGQGISPVEKITEDIALMAETAAPAIDATVSLLDELALSFESVAEAVSSTLGSLAELFNANFEEMKIVSIAQATIDTAAGVAKALGQGGWLGIAGAVSVGLAGAAQIKKIINTRPGSGSSSGGTAPVQSGTAPGATRMAPQRLNISGPTQKVELSGTLVAKGGDLVYVMNQQTRIGERAGV